MFPAAHCESNIVKVMCHKVNTLNHGFPTFLWQRTIPIIAGWFRDQTSTSRSGIPMHPNYGVIWKHIHSLTNVAVVRIIQAGRPQVGCPWFKHHTHKLTLLMLISASYNPLEFHICYTFLFSSARSSFVFFLLLLVWDMSAFVVTCRWFILLNCSVNVSFLVTNSSTTLNTSAKL